MILGFGVEGKIIHFRYLKFYFSSEIKYSQQEISCWPNEKFYRDAKNAEMVQEQSGQNTNVEINAKMAKELEKLYDNPFDD